MKLLLALPFSFVSYASMACFNMPAEANRDHASLVAEATAIVLIRVSSSSEPGKCAFNVVRVLKGNAPEHLPLTCRLPASGDWMTDFSSHKDQTFWHNGGGRLGISGDCSIIPPAFTPGKEYLVFLGIKPDIKQFEQVGPEDRWLRFVSERAKNTR